MFARFQYVLAASTSIATKNNEDTLTYLNQGQSYEIKLKKLGDLSAYRGKMLKSIIKICFHERRLQYMEREQMLQWQASRPGERIVEIDVPLSYGLCQVAQSASPQLLNTVEVLWDPMKEVGVYIQVNCISTEFTPKKHGGEKGVPFRIQVETYLDAKSTSGGILSGAYGATVDVNAPTLKLIHGAACQIKVFKLKGADRKHKQDREKIQKRSASEQEKYQPSYECTILTDIPNESIAAAAVTSSATSAAASPEHVANGGRLAVVPSSGNASPPTTVYGSRSPVHASFSGNGSNGNIVAAVAASTASAAVAAQQQQQQLLVNQQQQQSHPPIGINSVSSSNSSVPKHSHVQPMLLLDQSSSQSLSPRQNVVEPSDEVAVSSQLWWMLFIAFLLCVVWFYMFDMNHFETKNALLIPNHRTQRSARTRRPVSCCTG